jgi:hypothetical protein
MKISVLSFVAKLSQSTAALACIWVQQRSLNPNDFALVTLLSYLFLIFVFLDFGVSTRFIQNHFDNISEMKDVDEVSLLRSQLATYFNIFIKLSLLHSLISFGYCILIRVLTTYSISIGDAFSIVIVSSLFTMGSLVSKSLIACGKLSASVVLQLTGILFQLIWCLLGSLLDFSRFWFILSLACPNLLIGLATLYLLGFSKKDLKNLRSRFFKPALDISFSKAANSWVQTLQLGQYASALAIAFVSANKLSVYDFAVVMILYKVFQNLANALSINGLLKWRATSINQKNTAGKSQRFNIVLQASGALSISISASILIEYMWELAFNGLEIPNRSELLAWVMFVPLMIVYWNFYYTILALKKYAILIKSVLLQSGICLTVLTRLSDSTTYVYPLAYDLGLLLSILFLVKKLKVES